MNRATLQAAFVLHHRPYRDSSVIADIITPDFGKVSVLARGVRSDSSRRRTLLQPFRPLLASWVGRSDLKTLTTLEESGQALALNLEELGCAYYITELALRLLPAYEQNPVVFAAYAGALAKLAAANVSDYPASSFETTLREFELTLLECLGLLPDFACCENGHQPVDAEAQYYFDPVNAVATRSGETAVPTIFVSGRTLLALAAKEVTEFTALKESKQVMRQLIRLQLGSQPLKSRGVFAQLQSSHKYSEPDSTKAVESVQDRSATVQRNENDK